jgi:CHAT domain-containing protein
VVVPGLRLGLMRPVHSETPTAPLVIAVDAGELEAVHGETAAVLKAFPSARVLSGAEATADHFLALAPTADWIHFAGHGGWRADAPEASGLRLADRWLLAGELADITLSARWVTLSACHTARALVRPGEEWFGLARAFLLAGASAVVAAQWDVDDEATARLMSDLYARLSNGAPLARALASAQAERAEAGEHPIDWAGFAVLGGPRLLSDRSRRTGQPDERIEGSSGVDAGKTTFTSAQLVGFQQVPTHTTTVDLSEQGALPLHSLQHRRHG